MPEEEEKKRFVLEEDDPERWRRVLGETVEVLSTAGIPYLMIGSIARSAFGEDVPGSDVDVMVKKEDAGAALEALSHAGYSTERTEPEWLYKAVKDDVLIDVIFVVADKIAPDDEMFERGKVHTVKGHELWVEAPEDFLVQQAISNKEEADYWHSALTALKVDGLDWEYVLKRSTEGPLRVLSLLCYGLGEGCDIPRHVIDRLYRNILPRE